ncbi:cytochrome c [Neobacillus sp. WH10]|uniref:c-type cytochrome n=1 Tax=Neobacillus sp. WH10 TaxID=3047873 RepID=UPI0024C1E947|nr:cytochrome c [Neobacillus sp. WH10]WHY77016.1 cytochrome c [Neobacillus sp. WH10]
MKQLWIVTALAILVVTGCSSNSANNKAAMDGESIYANKCSACHGENLKGAVGPAVVNMAGKYSEKELLKLITEGTAQMPGNLLTDEQSKIVTEWLMEH